MSAALFQNLFRYKAKANQDLFEAVSALEFAERKEALHSAIRVLNHVYVVDRIFRAHLVGEPHGFTATNTTETPALAALRDAVLECDRWYVHYADGVGAKDLERIVDFQFTDGKHGRMSCEEILVHVATHGGYHRGAVGRILDQEGVTRPADGLTNFLHAAEPSRREQG